MPHEREVDPLIGQSFGAYKIEREIGRGGMGAVYLAVQTDQHFKRRVAIKLIKRGMDTDFVVRRFRQERQILASLNNSYIARLFDGGTTPDGLPYFVMEYVEGEPLFDYSDNKKLNTNERLQLFLKICEAVEAAHHQEIVHRDLKPSNILVTQEGYPKLLDFGIAKFLNPEHADLTIDPTQTAIRLMTPEYASPEQVRGETVTPASDVYSLGALLYQYLTGRRPYRFKSRAPHDITRIICEETPVSPSSVAENWTMSDEQSDALDRVILKAMRKNAAERYQTVAELREEITRILQNRPVLAESVAPIQQKEITAETNTDKQAIAVLPFKLLGMKNEGDEYLGIGLADALISRLSSAKRFVVRPTSSVLRYGEETDPFTAGQELGVEYAVDGNIRRAGERIRVTVQLLSVSENSTRWAQRFDERFSDVLELEDSISEKVIEALLPQLTGEEVEQMQKRGTDNAEAFEAYLRGRYFWNKFVPETFFKALESFEKAIALDPNYALAYVGLTDFYNWAGIFGILPSSECNRLAKSAALRALELDGYLAEAYASLGFVVAYAEFNLEEGRRLFKRALEINPNLPFGHESISTLLIGTGNIEEGLKEVKLAERLDPLSPRAMALTAWSLYQARRYDEAVAKARQMIEFDPHFPQGYIQSGNALIEMGRTAEAVEALRQGERLMPDSGIALYPYCFALVAINQRDEAQKVLDKMKALASAGYYKPYFIAMAHVALGDDEGAFEWFEKALAQGDGWFIWLGTEAKLDRLRNDPRFIELFKRTNNPLSLTTGQNTER